MLTVTIFATIVADMLPVSNNTPLIGQRLANNFPLVVPHPIPTQPLPSPNVCTTVQHLQPKCVNSGILRHLIPLSAMHEYC